MMKNKWFKRTAVAISLGLVLTITFNKNIRQSIFPATVVVHDRETLEKMGTRIESLTVAVQTVAASTGRVEQAVIPPPPPVVYVVMGDSTIVLDETHVRNGWLMIPGTEIKVMPWQ